MTNVTVTAKTAKHLLDSLEMLLDMHLDMAEDEEAMEVLWDSLAAMEQLGANATAIAQLRASILTRSIKIAPTKAITTATRQLELEEKRRVRVAELAAARK